MDLDPARFYLPAYMARHGWVGMRLDIEPIDWAQVTQLVEEAFLASAPKMVLKEYAAKRYALSVVAASAGRDW